VFLNGQPHPQPKGANPSTYTNVWEPYHHHHLLRHKAANKIQWNTTKAQV